MTSFQSQHHNSHGYTLAAAEQGEVCLCPQEGYCDHAAVARCPVLRNASCEGGSRQANTAVRRTHRVRCCEAIGEAAIQAGCRLFFGYPITPATPIMETLAKGRAGNMPPMASALGTPDDVRNVAQYVLSLSGSPHNAYAPSFSYSSGMVGTRFRYWAGMI